MSEKEFFVLDANGSSIYNALMVCKPDNQILLKAINQIVKNVKTKYYGGNCLEPTGPRLLEKFFDANEKQKIELKHSFFQHFSNRFIHYKNYIILKSYNGYLNEHQKHKKIAHYGVLWKKRQIYK